MPFLFFIVLHIFEPRKLPIVVVYDFAELSSEKEIQNHLK